MKRYLLVAAVAGMAFAGYAGTSPKWLRNTAISPDGQTIAFTFRGDIFTVPFSGGKALQLTSGENYETAPVWSPDGKTIAYASDLGGSLDVYVIPAQGGTPRRLTTHSSGETPLAFLDNETILFSGAGMPGVNDVSGFNSTQLYTVSVKGGRPKMYLSLPVVAASADGNGRVLYQDKKGYEDVFRKHERSSGTGDIWLAEGTPGNLKFRKLTDFNGHDINPAWGAGDTFYYVSEQDGILNVWKSDLDGNRRQLTSFKNHPVRSLSATKDGKMAFSWDGEIWTLTDGSEPRKVEVEINAQGPVENFVTEKRKSTGGAVTSYSVSPDGEEIAFVKNGDVYVTSVKYETTKQITDTPEQERVVSYSPDGKFLVYDSERNGLWQLYKAERVNPDEKNFTYATEIKETRITNSDKTSFQPSVSPDSKKVAFIEDRCGISVLDLASGKVVNVLPVENNYSYTDGDLSFYWNPDSEWLATSYMGPMGWNNLDVAMVKADGTKVVNLTESGYADEGMKFVMDGKALAWRSDKAGMRSHGSWGSQSDVYLMFLDPETYNKFKLTEEEIALSKKDEKEKENGSEKDGKKDKKDKKDKKETAKSTKKSFAYDFENRKNRVERITPASTAIVDYYLDEDGGKLYYLADYDDSIDLWMQDVKEGDLSKVAKNVGLGEIIADKDGKKLFIGGPAGLKVFDIASKELKKIDFEARKNYNPYAEREYIFDHVKRLVKDKFYDENLHGVDWEMYTDYYRQFLPFINNNYDFANVLSELLGELNASHTGGRYRPSAPSAYTVPFLGAFFDESYKGDGLRISEIVKGGPLAEEGLKSGDIITAIDGDKILAGQDYYPMLMGKTHEKVLLNVTAGGKDRKISVRPVSGGENARLLYKRWVRHNQHVVDSISNGRIAYVHVHSMNSDSFRDVYDELLGKYRNCDAVIVDTRHNGGGWLHNDIAVLLTGKEYVTFDPRGRRIGHEPFSRWTKPSVMLVDESNYSDAYGTPYTYKTLKIGKLIGAPVPGTMTAVWWETQVDPSIVFGVPQVTNSDLQGRPLENHQLDPDIIIYNSPAEIVNGIDRQLEGAVRELMNATK